MGIRWLRPLVCAAVLLASLLVAAPRSAEAAGFTVVVDAGHGGKDPGAVTPYLSESEKEVALRLALRTGAALQRRGIGVVYTRTDDRDVPLVARAVLASRVGASALLSLHLNSAPNPAAAGAEAWFGTGERDSALASAVLDAVAGPMRAAGSLVRGTRHGPELAVLRSGVPSVLLEVGYASNAAEARLLAQDGYLTAVAEALAEGLARFRDAGAPAVRRGSVAGASLHFVQVGDTLAGIASRVGIPVAELQRLNAQLAPTALVLGQPVLLKGTGPIANSSTGPSEGGSAPQAAPPPAPARPAMTANAPAIQGSTARGGARHTVVVGETLTGIGRRYGVKSADLARWNGLADPDYIEAGRSIVVSGPGVEVPGAAPVVGLPAGGETRIVRPGETLSDVALGWGVTVDALRERNDIADPDWILAGRVLYRPAASATGSGGRR